MVNTLDQPEMVQDLFDDCIAMTPHSALYVRCTEKPDIPKLFANLIRLAKFFAQNTVWQRVDDDESDYTAKDSMGLDEGSGDSWQSGSSLIINKRGVDANSSRILTLKYTAEEEGWLMNRFSSMDETYFSVGMGDDLMKEYVMFSLGVPMSKSFFPNTANAFGERNMRIMQQHPEFNALSDLDQMRMWQNSFLNGVALNIAMVECCCKSAEDQLAFSMGNMDSKFWEEDLKPVFTQKDSPKLRKVTMTEMNSRTKMLDAEQLKKFNALCESIASVIPNHDVYRILLLIVMFSSEENGQMPMISRLRERYFTVLRRRQSNQIVQYKSNSFFKDDHGANSDDTNDMDNYAFGRMIYSRFNSCLRDIKSLAMIISAIQPPSSSQNSTATSSGSESCRSD